MVFSDYSFLYQLESLATTECSVCIQFRYLLIFVYVYFYTYTYGCTHQYTASRVLMLICRITEVIP